MGKIKQKWARIHDPQDPVDIKWPGLRFDREPLAGNHLKDIAGLDVLLAMPHNRFVFGPGEIRPRLERDRRFRVDVAQPEVGAGRRQTINQFVDLIAGCFVGGLAVSFRPDMSLRHHEDRFADMIEYHHPIIKRERKIRQSTVVRRRVRQLFGVAHGIVRGIAHRAPRESRQAAQLRRAISFNQLTESLNGSGDVNRRSGSIAAASRS